jgi:AP-2 complex subunit beta-1
MCSISPCIRYASEVDIDFVRKAVRSIGRLAIKVETASENCIQTLLNLIETKVTYVVQEAIIVIKDVFRRFPGKYEGIIPTLCENLDALDEPEAKAAMIWILGQFADRIDNADELLDDLLYTFLEETPEASLVCVSSLGLASLSAPTGPISIADGCCQALYLQIQDGQG